MFGKTALFLICVISTSWSQDFTFPAEFKFGAASSAFQMEGAWNISDKSKSVWDQYLQDHPNYKSDRSTAEVACDSYHRWKADVQIVAETGLNIYRFSISWTRLLPNGFSNHISENGKNCYSNLIDGLLEKDIEPMVTMYHFDLPQSLQDLGGWANPLIAVWFGDYARVLFTLFGDRVKTWLTINEPVLVCDAAYEGIIAPGLDDSIAGMYLCTKNVLMAHATAWRIYDEEFKPKYHGRISMPLLFFWFEPMTKEDEDVTELVAEFMESKFGNPIYSKEGGWPPKVKEFLDERSNRPSYPYYGLPDLTQEEINFIRGTYDFYALNHYTSMLVRRVEPGDKLGLWPFDGPKELGLVLRKDPVWKMAGPSWFSIYPEGLRKQIAWLRQRYGDLEFIITENGYASNSASHDDQKRVSYMRDYMEQVLLCIQEDGANITGYVAWALMDGFEWMSGYQTSYGLYHVNFASPDRNRTPRSSARFYRDVATTKRLNSIDNGFKNNVI